MDYTLDSQYDKRNNFLVQLLTFHFLFILAFACVSKKIFFFKHENYDGFTAWPNNSSMTTKMYC